MVTMTEVKVSGKHRRDRPRRQWKGDIVEWSGMNMTEAGRFATEQTM